MNRNPLKWYWDAIEGRNPPVTTEPQAGYFVAKIGGKMVPARLYWEGPLDDEDKPCGDEILRCEIGGVEHDPVDAWLWCAKRPVKFDEYVYWLGQSLAEEST